MSRPLTEGRAWALAGVLSLPAFMMPAHNPDLFWHLSAARWIIAHRALPHSDWLSFTQAGAPWLDFEWLTQIVFEGAYRNGGFFALWLLKGFLLLGIWLALDRALKLNGVPGPARAGGLVLWSTAALMHADIRPDLFSLLFFAILLCALEALRLGRIKAGAKAFLGAVFFFALWASLHLGFIFGLGLISAYGLAAIVRKEEGAAKSFGGLLGAAVLGTLLNPYGVGPYQVAWSHWAAGAELSRYIAEWHSMTARNPVFWPFWLLLPLTAAAIFAWRRQPRQAPWPVALAAAGLALAALRHERTSSYFNIVSVLLICLAVEKEGPQARRVLRGAVALCACFALWVSPRIYRRGFFNYKFVPRAAAEFISRERPVFEGLRVYNPWEWGGYLGWRLSPWYKVFDDGRYLFHEELPREAAAVADFALWRKFMDSERIDAVLLQNLPKMFPTTKVYPDGSRKDFDRPYYLFYAPIESWALVHWDPTALVLVRRGAVPAGWLAQREYRYLRPRDTAAFSEAMRRGEIPKTKVEAEALRHQSEMRELERGF